MSLRPQRVRVTGEIGRPRTLPSGADSFEKRGRGPEVVFFGLGPEPEKLPAYFPKVKSARFIECPDFEAQMDEDWAGAIPGEFTRMDPDELTPEFIRRTTVYSYAENRRIFPSFWGPLVARLALSHLGAAPPATETVAWLPGTERDLLTRELEVSLKLEGLRTERVDPTTLEGVDQVAWRLTQDRPALFFSVNFKGLGPYGERYHLLRQAGARVAVWCVDNPFQQLTTIKSEYWKELDIFVTDDWFIEPLRRLGARRVHHLPLAASPGLFRDACRRGEFSDLADRLVFVGRSEFPAKKRFFSGVRLPEAAWQRARARLDQGVRPGFDWWADRLGVDPPWPGNEVRAAGLGADETGRAWRTLCLRSAGPRLTVFGDEGWRTELAEGTDVRGPVDYYDELPAVYCRAACVLNMTSPLLPRGLTQRHFDVWLAGGRLITDDTPGLSIFPEELVREITFSRPSEIEPLFQRFAATGAGSGVGAAWREVIRAGHTYTHRMRTVLDALGL